MPSWIKPYRIRRSSKMLSFAVRQNYTALELMGEEVYLLKRQRRADATFHFTERKVSTISQTASAYTTDADTGMLKYTLWNADTNDPDEYPDIGVCTVTVTSSGGTVTEVWEAAYDKYSFISGRTEFAFDIFRNQLDTDGNAITDAVYVVFNTPPFTSGNVVIFNFGTINPATDFTNMQPDIDNEADFSESLFGYEQWLKSNARIRTRNRPHRFPIAFPGVARNLLVEDGGLVRETRTMFWTNPPPYCPEIVEHDVIIRAATGERFQVVDYTPIYIENILVSQQFNLAELDPRSSIYNLSVDTG